MIKMKKEGTDIPPVLITGIGLVVMIVSIILNKKIPGKFVLFIIVGFGMLAYGAFRVMIERNTGHQETKKLREKHKQEDMLKKQKEKQQKSVMPQQQVNRQKQATQRHQHPSVRLEHPYHQPVQRTAHAHQRTRVEMPHSPTRRIVQQVPHRQPHDNAKPFCPECGNNIRSYDNFCSYCGARLR